jgi:hypothetical protein
MQLGVYVLSNEVAMLKSRSGFRLALKMVNSNMCCHI